MLQAEDALFTTAKRVITTQLAIVTIATVISLIIKDLYFAGSLLYGGAIVLIGTSLQYWRLKVATEGEEQQPVLKPGLLIQGMVLKMVVMLIMLAIGMRTLQLVPIALLIGLVLAYSGYFFGRGYAPRSRG